jgi:short-subunit dehydrogenase
VLTSHGRLDVVLYSAGHYQAMQADSFDLRQMLHHLQVNYVGALNLLDAVLPVLLRQQHGHVSLVASVAGFRGLPKALAYGPTKAALIHLAEALYLDLRPQGIGVSVINPGFVATPLTAGNRFDMPALITPEQAATAIVSGWKRGRFGIDFPKRFTFWLQLMRLLPYSAYFAIVRRVTRA